MIGVSSFTKCFERSRVQSVSNAEPPLESIKWVAARSDCSLERPAESIGRLVFPFEPPFLVTQHCQALTAALRGVCLRIQRHYGVENDWNSPYRNLFAFIQEKSGTRLRPDQSNYFLSLGCSLAIQRHCGVTVRRLLRRLQRNSGVLFHKYSGTMGCFFCRLAPQNAK